MGRIDWLEKVGWLFKRRRNEKNGQRSAIPSYMVWFPWWRPSCRNKFRNFHHRSWRYPLYRRGIQNEALNLAKEGMSDEGVRRSQTLLKTYRDFLRIKLGNYPPAKVYANIIYQLRKDRRATPSPPRTMLQSDWKTHDKICGKHSTNYIMGQNTRSNLKITNKK